MNILPLDDMIDDSSCSVVGAAALGTCEVLADAADPEHRDLFDWGGGPIDPAHVDVADVNGALQRLR